ncbi:hypothetical protein AYO40_00080 [Planctomycetaceae bacterium SCGC AG-212-D15]|nr:hypothetical protein AYO40_00080 [Planctomycetaceae bacterium SCGC AG-212-D15]
MMAVVVSLIHVTGLYPLVRAWRANRRTTLFQAIHWATAAWLAWGFAFAAESALSDYSLGLIRYLALCLTTCAGVAALGLGGGAWNFVLLGLLAIMLLPLAEGLLARGALHLEGPRLLFLAAALAVIVLNYLPTRLGLAALLLGIGSAVQLLLLGGSMSVGSSRTVEQFGGLLLALVPWAALERMAHRPAPVSEFDGIWLDFRDRFGLVWSQRVREQFNSSAAHHGWPVILRWQGLRVMPGSELPPPDEQQAMLEVLRSLLKRFRDEAQAPDP